MPICLLYGCAAACCAHVGGAAGDNFDLAVGLQLTLAKLAPKACDSDGSYSSSRSFADNKHQLHHAEPARRLLKKSVLDMQRAARRFAARILHVATHHH